jgi:N-sulfoglucosamine sulfohydrolase
MTGRYPHRSGALGFDPIRQDVPTLVEALKSGGYFTGIMAKVSHVVPARGHAWDVVVKSNELRWGRDPELFYQHAVSFFNEAREAGKPFFLMTNSEDPHRPFAGSAQEHAWESEDQVPGVSRAYAPEEIGVPAFLPDVPGVRQEMSEYYTSVHRADETVGRLLEALEESGLSGNTMVMFLSDNGMAMPLAKTNVYRDSTRTPWIVRWPGKVEPGTREASHFVSGIDLAPAILEAAGLEPLEGADGHSFLPLLKGESQQGRRYVFTYMFQTIMRDEYPMRSIQDARYGYIYNAWADGQTVFRNMSQTGLAMNAMRAAATVDENVAARLAFLLYRTPEEFYDYEADPHALDNLIDRPDMQDRVQLYRDLLLEHMRSNEDPILPEFSTLVETSRTQKTRRAGREPRELR